MFPFSLITLARGIGKSAGPVRSFIDAHDLVPERDLEPLPGRAGTWRSLGVDPQFRVACLMPAGWFRVRLQMTCAQQAHVEILADSGQGFAAADCFERINYCGTSTRDFLVNLPRPIRGFRLDPLDAPGEFRLEQLRIEPVSRCHVLQRALRSAWEGFHFDRSALGGLFDTLRLLGRGQWGRIKSRLLESVSGPSALAPPLDDPVRAYAAWRQRRQMTSGKLHNLRATIAALENPPFISLLLPAANETRSAVHNTIASVLAQV